MRRHITAHEICAAFCMNMEAIAAGNSTPTAEPMTVTTVAETAAFFSVENSRVKLPEP